MGLATGMLEKILGTVQRASGDYPDSAQSRYKDAGGMKQTATEAGVVDARQLTQEVHGGATPLVAEDIVQTVQRASGDYPDSAQSRYKDAGGMKQTATEAGVVDARQLTQEVHGGATPLVAEDIVQTVQRASGDYPDSAQHRYSEAGNMSQVAREAGIVNSGKLTKQVHEGATPLVTQDVVQTVERADGSNPDSAQHRYKDAGGMKQTATEAGIVNSGKLTEQVHEQITPLVVDDVTEHVGLSSNPKTLSRKYPVGGEMLGTAKQADIVDPGKATSMIDANLRPGLKEAQLESFRSGNWDKLTLQKIAEESKLFRPETLRATQKLITDLLKDSIRIAMNWGDRQGAIDKLELVHSTGLITDAQAEAIRKDSSLIGSRVY